MSDTSLRKTLGVARGTALMLNIVLGAGLLTLPGLAYREADQQAIFIWLACAAAAVPLLAVFAIVGRRFPDAGGIPAVAGKIFGPLAYRAATFLFFGAVSLGLPAIALTGGYYAASFIGASPYLLGFVILVLAVLVNFLSVEQAGRLNGIIASTLIFVLLVIVIAGAYSVLEQASPAPIAVDLNVNKFTALFMMVFFAFTGWEVAANLSEEFRNPERDIPRAMGLSFVLALGFYLSLAVIVGASGLSAGFEAPFATIIGKRFGPISALGIATAAVLLVFANLSAATWAVSRMVVSAAREGLLPASLSITHKGTPFRAVLIVLVVLSTTILMAGLRFFSLDRLLEYAGQNFLLIYALAAAALLKAGPGNGVRVIAGLSLAIVVAIAVNRNIATLAYPAVLCSFAVVSTWLIRPKS